MRRLSRRTDRLEPRVPHEKREPRSHFGDLTQEEQSAEASRCAWCRAPTATPVQRSRRMVSASLGALPGGFPATFRVGSDTERDLSQSDRLRVADLVREPDGPTENDRPYSGRGRSRRGGVTGLIGERARHAIGLAGLQREKQGAGPGSRAREECRSCSTRGNPPSTYRSERAAGARSAESSHSRKSRPRSPDAHAVEEKREDRPDRGLGVPEADLLEHPSQERQALLDVAGTNELPRRDAAASSSAAAVGAPVRGGEIDGGRRAAAPALARASPRLTWSRRRGSPSFGDESSRPSE